jgi:S-adenosylmethionine-diacylgycerolhomoserine-N-methlytransferase
MSSESQIRNYYRWHAGIYDWTRWAFLFGRHQLIDAVADHYPKRVLEFGCGTGRNLVQLSTALPESEIVGVDLSIDMIEKARWNTRHLPMVETYCDRSLSELRGRFDVIVLSYVLSMLEPTQQKEVLNRCSERLAPDGVIAIVDFADSPWQWFRTWMGWNHVDLSGNLLRQCQHRFGTQVVCRSAYFGLWRYLRVIAAPLRPR